MFSLKAAEHSEVVIKFFHDKEKGTKCLILHGHETVPDCEKEVIGQGEAALSPGDQFSRKVGREISLKRALEGHSREFRYRAWQSYLPLQGRSISELSVRGGKTHDEQLAQSDIMDPLNMEGVPAPVRETPPPAALVADVGPAPTERILGRYSDMLISIMEAKMDKMIDDKLDERRKDVPVNTQV